MTPKMRIGILIFVAAAAFSGCSQLGMNKEGGSPTTPTGPLSPGSAIIYAAVGASDVDGYGSSKPCIPFDDCNGNGYVWVAARQLRAQGFTVEVNQLGLAGGVISPAFQNLAVQYGRNDIPWNIVQQGMPFVRRDATLATVFVGGNDVNVISDAVARGAGGNDPSAFVDQMVGTFGTDFGTLIAGIRDRAPSARVVVLNLPNLAGMPYMAGESLARKQVAQRAAVRITTAVINSYPGIKVVDLMCDPRLYQPSILSADGFHPNDTGYSIIGAEVVSAVTSPSYPAPRSSCAQMTLF